MLDESIVQFHGRIRVHATKRVESKRNEVMAVQAAALGSHGARCPNGAACSTGRNLAGTQHRCGHRGMERSTHPTPQGVARGEQLLGRIETMLDESIVQKLCRMPNPGACDRACRRRVE